MELHNLFAVVVSLQNVDSIFLNKQTYEKVRFNINLGGENSKSLENFSVLGFTLMNRSNLKEQL